MKYLSLIISAGILLSSCGAENQQSNDAQTTEPEKLELASPTCSYEYVNENTSLEWTAYKTTDKVAVGGKFDEFNVSVKADATDALSILEGAKFEISTASTNTNNEDRDMKIKTQFFGSLNATDKIFGRVNSLTGDENSGDAMIEISMNGLSKEVPAKYTIDGANLSLETEFDMQTWDGMAAIAALNKVCEDLHKGADGVSKLWSTVSVKVSTTLKKNCE